MMDDLQDKIINPFDPPVVEIAVAIKWANDKIAYGSASLPLDQLELARSSKAELLIDIGKEVLARTADLAVQHMEAK